MKAKYFLFTPLLMGFLYFMLIANSSGPASTSTGNRTGSPGSSGTCSNCHSGGSFGTSITASVTDLLGNSVTSYIPGNSYYIEYQVSSTSGSPQYGFQSIMLTSSNANAGDFDSTLTTNTKITTLSGKKLPEHSAKSSTGIFKVRWVAPSVGTGTVTLYYIGNAVNSNFGTSGDLPTSSQNLTLTEQPVLTVVLSQVGTINCYGDTNIGVNALVTNAAMPINYNWSTGLNVTIANGSLMIPNLGAGTYFVTVTDANSDVSIDSLVVSQPAQIISTISSTDETCYQMADGSAMVNVSGGTTPYSYMWSNGSMSSSLSNVAGGVYYVTITDSNSCTHIDTATITGATQIIVNPGINNPACVGTTNGLIALTVSGGTLPYSYVWDTGDTGFIISGLDTGMYSVTISDGNGCQVIENYQLSTTNMPATITFSAINPTCNTSMNGAIAANVSGGVMPYNFVWSTGDTDIFISNLDTGTYTLGVLDSVGCVSVGNYSLVSDNIVPIVNLGPDTVICSQDVGSFAIDAGNLMNDYSYLWNTADTTYSLTIFFTGNYWLEVTDSVGCTGVDSIFVDEQICSGIEDLFTSEQISIYPLPASNVLNIDTENEGLIEIYDLFGKMIQSTDISIGKTQVDVSQLSQGTYILHFISEKGEGVKKIMIL